MLIIIIIIIISKIQFLLHIHKKDLFLLPTPTEVAFNTTNSVKHNQSETRNFDFPTAKVEDINMVIKSLNPRKATAADGISAKILKIVRNVIDSHLTNIINIDIKENKFSEDAKLLL